MGRLKNYFIFGATYFASHLGIGLFGEDMVSKIEDRFKSTPQEIKLEEILEKPIYFNFNSGQEKKENLLREFESAYDLARENWDNFDEQWDLVRSVRLETESESPKVSGEMDRFRRLCMTLYGDDSEHAVLVHELAHLWEKEKTDQRFLERWQEISEGEYTSDWTNTTEANVINNGSVSLYSMKDLKEDVATMVEFVYTLNSPGIYVWGYPNKSLDEDFHLRDFSLSGYRDFIDSNISMPKIKEKLKLLREYDFFSEKEYEIALSEMEEYHSRCYQE